MSDNNLNLLESEPNKNTINIEEEMQQSFLDYAMSVIMSRALPDIRDGLKPVHRRILYAMARGGYASNKPFSKSARIVGDTIAQFHPHGDVAIYDTLVRMTQSFSMRVPVVDGQGNFGSLDDDPPAAMRYTEVRLSKAGELMLKDLDTGGIVYQPNYDGKTKEPTVLATLIPYLLVNGTSGIAVGMATNIPPHNLGEVIDALLHIIDYPEATIGDVLNYIKGPDFPTGGIILGNRDFAKFYTDAKGAFTLRAKVVNEKKGERDVIVITEVPYQTNKAALIEKIAELVKDKKIEGISDLRDESDRHGVRVVIELKRDAIYDLVLNQLYKNTAMQLNFNMNILAIDGGKPEQVSLMRCLQAFVDFRKHIVFSRNEHELQKARERAHILVALAITLVSLDEIIVLIRTSSSPSEAKERLLNKSWPVGEMSSIIALIADPRHVVKSDGTYQLSIEQAEAILELRLHRLTALGRDDIQNEMNELKAKIENYLDILGNIHRLMGIVKQELQEVKANYATPRLSEIVFDSGDLNDEDLIKSEDMVVTLTHQGYVKRVPFDQYKAQKRGGRGKIGMNTRDEDVVTRLMVGNTHDQVLFFATNGLVYSSKIWQLPLGNPQNKGKSLVNLFPIDKGVNIAAMLIVPDIKEEIAISDEMTTLGIEEQVSSDEWCIMFSTSKGNVRRNLLKDFLNIRSNGKIAMKLDDDEFLVGVQLTKGLNDCVLATFKGRVIRFSVNDVRVFKSRDSNGVRGIRLLEGDKVISMTILNSLEFPPSPDEVRAYLKQANKKRKELFGDEEELEVIDHQEEDEVDLDESELSTQDIQLDDHRIQYLQTNEQFILTVTDTGYAKRTSAYAYRRMSNRGGMGVLGMNITKKGNKSGLVGCFGVKPTDSIVAVSNVGQMIRVNADEVSIQGRGASGVRLFRLVEGESLVSVVVAPEENSDES